MAPPPPSVYAQALFTTVTPVVGALIVLFNALQLWLNSKGRGGKTTKSFIYITNVCVSDIVVGAGMIVLKSMNPFMKTSLKGNLIAENIYDIIRFLVMRLSMITSVLSLLALTFDRYAAITRPLSHRKRGKAFCVRVVILIWVVSFVCTGTVYAIVRLKIGDVELHKNLVFPLATYPTTIVFIACYSIIYKTLSSRPLGNVNKNQHAAAQMKFLRLAIATVSVFCVCWIPLATCSALKAARYTCGGKDIERTLFVLAFSNSLLNSFVYFLFSRRNIVKIFLRKGVPTSGRFTNTSEPVVLNLNSINSEG